LKPPGPKIIAFALWLIAIAGARGQGGPPMITDDPGTPGDGKFEVNLAFSFERRPNEVAWDAPAIDFNYGLGDRIQLTLQTAPAWLKRSGRGLIAGLGGTEAAVKWRFVDDQRTGVTVSIFPRLLFNLSQASVRRGLAEDGTRVQLPIQIAKSFGGWDINFEWGALAGTAGPAEWLYGFVYGVDVTKTMSLMAELHGTARSNFDNDVLAVNFGIRQNINKHWVFIGSLGHEVRAPQGQPLALIGYCGLQLLF